MNVIVINDFPVISRELKKELGKIVRAATLKTGKLIADNIVIQDAVDTGYMLNTVERHVDVKNLRGEITTDAEYFGFVNYGTVDQPARPFIEPSVDAARLDVEIALGGIFSRQLIDAMKADAPTGNTP